MTEEVHTDGSPQAEDPLLHDKVDGAPTTSAMGPVDNIGLAAGSLQALHSPAALTSESIKTTSPQLQVGPYTDVPPCREAEASLMSDIIHVCGSSEVILQSDGQLNCECPKPSLRHRSTTVDLIQHSLSNGPSSHFDAPSFQTPGSRQRHSTKAATAESYSTMRSTCNQSAEQLATRFTGADKDQETLHNCRINSNGRDDNCIDKKQHLSETSIPDRPTPPPATLVSTTASSCSSLASSPKFGGQERHLSMLQNSSAAWTSCPDFPSCQLQFSSHQTRRYSQLRRSRSLPSSVSSQAACYEERDGEWSPLMPSVPGSGCTNGTPRSSYSEAHGAMNASPISSAFTEPHPSFLRPPVTRSRGKSLLSPVQLYALRRKLETKAVSINDSGFGKGALGYLGQKIIKGGKQRVSDSHDSSHLSNIANSSKTRCEHGKKKSPLTSSTPVLVFQPHDTEISTRRSSVSGRLILLVPQVHGQRFQFVSLVLHLRLKESITWTRQDLISFEIEKEHWAQTIWEKKVILPFQDRQVEEGIRHRCSPYLSSAAAVIASTAQAVPTMLSPFTATDHPSPHVANTASLSSLSTRPRSASDINRESHAESLPPDTSLPTMDEWRWEWLIPVSKYGTRPESFEGAMGMVWYELEAKCLFRWDKIDENGQVISVGNTNSTVQVVDTPQALRSSNRNCSKGQVKSQLGSIKMLKGLGATTNSAKSIATVFGKLRAGNRDGAESKGKKTPHAVGDFILGTQHDEYMKESIKKSQQAATAAAAVTTARELTRSVNDDQNGVGSTALLSVQKITNPNDVDGTGETRPSEIPQPIPFLVRKVIKLHFNRSPQGPSSNAGYFLPPPIMSLPTLPSTRRLKAIIPGAKIQVHIQVPSVIPIPGYAQTSLLVPSPKTGGLVPKVKRCDGGGDPGLLGTGTAFRDQYIGHCVGKDAKMNRPPSRLDPRYPDSFQVALTIRKLTTHDINKSDILRRRYENAEVAAKTMANHANSSNREEGGLQGLPRTWLLSGTCTKSNQSSYESAPGSGTVPCKSNRAAAATCTTPNLECREQYENAGKVCRREIRVRQIKCEFWQKESCRIPTDDAPSRSIKFPLAPVFIYSEKEHEKERIREMAACNHNPARCIPLDSTDGTTSLLSPPQGSAISTSRICDDGGMSAPIIPAAKCATTTDCSHNPSPLKPPPLLNAGERKCSLGSIFSTSLQRSACSSLGMTPASAVLNPSYTYPSPGTNHPFTLLIPVPLDSPKLRQTYDWPSSNMPSPIIPSAYDYAMPGSLISETGLGQGSEFDSTSQSTTHDTGETDSRGAGGHMSPTLANTSATKARIVVKHHLSFRLSIDVFEYEGEFEQEDMDLEAIEYQQLQRAKGLQALSLRPHSGPTDNSEMGLQDLEEHYSTLEETMCSGRLKGETEEQHALANNSAVVSGLSPLPFELTGVNELNGNSVRHYSQPALPLFNSAAGLLDLDQDDGCLVQKPPSSRLACALPSQRCGSQGSLETTGSNYSSSNGMANSENLLRAHTCNNVSGTSGGGGSALHPLADASSGSGGDHGGGSGGLMAGAIGALKKKASFSGLAHALGTTATSLAAHHPRQQPSQASSNQSRVDVRKLKDFVIRVPVTVVIQVDEQGRAVGAHGTTGSCNNVRGEDMGLGQKDVSSTLLRQSHAPDEETSVSGSAVATNLATTARSVVTEPSAGRSETKFRNALERTEARSCLSKIAAPMGASSMTRSEELVASSSTRHWNDGLWLERESDQRVSSLEHADEEFSDDFIVVDAEEVDGNEL